MAPPTNLTPETALALGPLPVDLTLDVSEAPGGDHDVWFTYTPTGEVEQEIGWFASMGVATVYTQVLVGPVDALEDYLDFYHWAPMQIPVAPGVTYYFHVMSDATAPLVLSVIAGPDVAAPIGSLVVNDDETGYPIAVLSPTTGEVLQYRPFLAGETGAVLVTGPSLWEDKEDLAALHLFDNTLTEIASPAWARAFREAPIGSNRQTRFYVSRDATTGGDPVEVTTINADGTFGPRIWHLTTTSFVYAIEPSRDETILYYVTNRSLVPVQRWDLVNDVALADLAPAVADYQTLGTFGMEFLVLPDGSIVVPYLKFTVPLHAFVRRYSPAGAILNTYDLGNIEVNRVAYDGVDNPDAFWVWSYLLDSPTTTKNRNGRCRFDYLRVSDGAVLRTFETVLFSGGAHDNYDASAPPDGVRFGHALSCPFYALPYALPPWGDTPPVDPDPEESCPTDEEDWPIDADV